jgi:ribonuclease-3
MMEEPEKTHLLPEENPAEILHDLQAALGHVFANTELLKTALRHRSYVNQIRDHDPGEDNQRLEFLGDAVLSIAVSTLLYRQFPEGREGVLSRMRAGLVNETRLAVLARRVGVDRAIQLGRGEETTGGRQKNSILADALEAILGAAYLDGGLTTAMGLVQRLWGDWVVRSSRDDFLKDFKTRLQEAVQRNGGPTPEYQLVGSEGPDHQRVFDVALVVEGQVVSTGRGRSKKEAEQAAAKAALDQMDEAGA